MEAEDKRLTDEHARARQELSSSREEDEETQVYFIAPGFLTQFDRDCGEAANLASVYVIDAHNTLGPRPQLAPDSRQGEEQAGRLSRVTPPAHVSALNFLLVPAKKKSVETGEPVLIFLIFKSVFTHSGLAPYAHKPAFARTLSRFIDVQVLSS